MGINTKYDSASERVKVKELLRDATIAKKKTGFAFNVACAPVAKKVQNVIHAASRELEQVKTGQELADLKKSIDEDLKKKMDAGFTANGKDKKYGNPFTWCVKGSYNGLRMRKERTKAAIEDTHNQFGSLLEDIESFGKNKVKDWTKKAEALRELIKKKKVEGHGVFPDTLLSESGPLLASFADMLTFATDPQKKYLNILRKSLETAADDKNAVSPGEFAARKHSSITVAKGPVIDAIRKGSMNPAAAAPWQIPPCHPPFFAGGMGGMGGMMPQGGGFNPMACGGCGGNPMAMMMQMMMPFFMQMMMQMMSGGMGMGGGMGGMMPHMPMTPMIPGMPMGGMVPPLKYPTAEDVAKYYQAQLDWMKACGAPVAHAAAAPADGAAAADKADKADAGKKRVHFGDEEKEKDKAIKAVENAAVAELLDEHAEVFAHDKIEAEAAEVAKKELEKKYADLDTEHAAIAETDLNATFTAANNLLAPAVAPPAAAAAPAPAVIAAPDLQTAAQQGVAHGQATDQLDRATATYNAARDKDIPIIKNALQLACTHAVTPVPPAAGAVNPLPDAVAVQNAANVGDYAARADLHAPTNAIINAAVQGGNDAETAINGALTPPAPPAPPVPANRAAAEGVINPLGNPAGVPVDAWNAARQAAIGAYNVPADVQAAAQAANIAVRRHMLTSADHTALADAAAAAAAAAPGASAAGDAHAARAVAQGAAAAPPAGDLAAGITPEVRSAATKAAERLTDDNPHGVVEAAINTIATSDTERGVWNARSSDERAAMVDAAVIKAKHTPNNALGASQVEAPDHYSGNIGDKNTARQNMYNAARENILADHKNILIKQKERLAKLEVAHKANPTDELLQELKNARQLVGGLQYALDLPAYDKNQSYRVQTELALAANSAVRTKLDVCAGPDAANSTNKEKFLNALKLQLSSERATAETRAKAAGVIPFQDAESLYKASRALLEEQIFERMQNATRHEDEAAAAAALAAGEIEKTTATEAAITQQLAHARAVAAAAAAAAPAAPVGLDTAWVNARKADIEREKLQAAKAAATAVQTRIKALTGALAAPLKRVEEVSITANPKAVNEHLSKLVNAQYALDELRSSMRPKMYGELEEAIFGQLDALKVHAKTLHEKRVAGLIDEAEAAKTGKTATPAPDALLLNANTVNDLLHASSSSLNNAFINKFNDYLGSGVGVEQAALKPIAEYGERNGLSYPIEQALAVQALMTPPKGNRDYAKIARALREDINNDQKNRLKEFFEDVINYTKDDGSVEGVSFPITQELTKLFKELFDRGILKFGGAGLNHLKGFFK